MNLSTRAEVHRFLMMSGYDISDRTVRAHIKKGSLPTEDSGLWDTEKVLAWASTAKLPKLPKVQTIKASLCFLWVYL